MGRIVSSVLVLVLSFGITGCNNILGDGEVNIVTAPPIVTPKVTVYDSYGTGEATRFDIGGQDAFYLLPGIDNNPDNFQDFICLDYTKEGYFIYYYCAPAYIGIEDIAALNDGQEHEASKEPYTKYDDSISSKVDAAIVMGYNPDTGMYKVIDAQGFEHITANTESDGQANTGIEFYKSSKYNFYMLSHLYGCKIYDKDSYFIFDQDGKAKIYGSDFGTESELDLGRLLDFKVKEFETDLKNKYDDDDDISSIRSDISSGQDSSEEMGDAMKELSEATNKSYDNGNNKVKNLELKYLVKSAVCDGTGKIFFSLMIYTGESPWSSVILFNRVCSVTTIDLSGNFSNTISVNTSYERQKALYEENAVFGMTMDDIRNGAAGDLIDDYYGYYSGVKAQDSFTQFYAESVGPQLFMAGWPKLDYREYKKELGDDPINFAFDLCQYYMSRAAKRFKASTLEGRIKEAISFFDFVQALPKMGSYNPDINMHNSSFSTTPIQMDYQALAFVYVFADDITYGNQYWSPKMMPVVNLNGISTDSPKVYYEPYEYNSDMEVKKDVSNYVADEEKAATIVSGVLDIFENHLLTDRETIYNVLLNYAENYDNPYYFYKYIYFGSELALRSEIVLELENKGFDREKIYHALKGEVSSTGKTERARDEELSIPAGTFPISYRLVFPKGAYIEYADLDTSEGSSNTSIQDGALLFYDTAKLVNGVTNYKAGIRYERQTGKVFEDNSVKGTAIDTGTLSYTFENFNYTTHVFMLITSEGVKFYFPSLNASYWDYYHFNIEDLTYSGERNCIFIENEKLLSSSGFTPYTEAATQAAVSERIDSTDIAEEKTENSVTATQKDVTVSLNSSRVGTIQSASSFTAINNQEILISAYDSGLSLLRFYNLDMSNTEKTDFEVLHLQEGSYYQSFYDSNKDDYKIIGFNTEDYMYGSMDIARAKVYDYTFNKEKDEILDTALEKELDQMAVDYVRRLHRTRVDIEEDDEGNITSQKTVILPFEDDHSEEAESERLLFEKNEATAKSQLKVMAEKKGTTSIDSTWEYLLTLRERVKNQQKALNEIFDLTKASKLGSKLKTDTYWVGLMERLQYTTDMGDFKDILAEIVTEDSMISMLAASNPEAADTYREFKETLNYKEEAREQNEALSEVKLGAQNLESLLDTMKTPKEHEEEYSELERGQEKEADPLEEALNTEGIINDTDSKEDKPDRMQIRALILEDIENYYFEINPLEPQKVYAPDGTYSTIVESDREDEVWEEYLIDLLYRINPSNLSALRDNAVEQFAEFSYTTARTVEGGIVTDNQLTVSEDVQEKMKQEITDGIDKCETIADVEALFFGTQIKNLGNPYGNYRDSFVSWENKSFTTESEKAKAMRSSDWYQKLYELATGSTKLQEYLDSKGTTWHEYIQAVFSGKTGNVLRDDQTGETANANTTAASSFAQLVEFMCEGAGTVEEQTKIDMVEDLLIGLETISGAESVEEAVMVERMTLPAYEGYMKAYEAFNKKNFAPDTNTDQEEDNKSDPVTFEVSSEGSLRRKALVEEEFYKAVIGSMKESELLKAYLEAQNQTWEEYMASLATLASNSNITDAAASARKIYETFEPFEPVENTNKASDGTEERPVAYSTTENSGN
ncbi:MAG: hypothetical protein K6A23_10335 [Butyrivibrio sp.]|nr:hypothetical protein [Butyrivibrio sp.]